MSKTLFFGIAGLILLSIVGVFAYNVNQQINGYPSDSPSGKYILNVEEGQTLQDIAPKLESDKVVVTASGFLFQAKINTSQPLLTGEYEIKVPAKPVDILTQLDQQTEQKVQEAAKAAKLPSVSLTFREGLDLDDMFKLLEEQGVVSAIDMQNFAKDPANFSRERFPFLPEPLKCTYGDLKNCAKYYVEGFAYPDTYSFFKPSKPEDVFEKMLANFNNKVWLKYKSQTTGKDFQKIITLASVLERETGRTKGVTAANYNEVLEERETVSSVFYNRVEDGMKWQSNPTVEYGQGYILCEQTFKRDGCKFLDDAAFQTKYNTYLVSGYPIGPITNPQAANIEAALNPKQTDYLFFVADLTGKTYFAEDENGHAKVIQQVNKINEALQ